MCIQKSSVVVLSCSANVHFEFFAEYGNEFDVAMARIRRRNYANIVRTINHFSVQWSVDNLIHLQPQKAGANPVPTSAIRPCLFQATRNRSGRHKAATAAVVTFLLGFQIRTAFAVGMNLHLTDHVHLSAAMATRALGVLGHQVPPFNFSRILSCFASIRLKFSRNKLFQASWFFDRSS